MSVTFSIQIDVNSAQLVFAGFSALFVAGSFFINCWNILSRKM